MCQVSVVVSRNGHQEKIMENVALLEVEPNGIRISTLFEEPRLVAGARLDKIDFLNGTVILQSDQQE